MFEKTFKNKKILITGHTGFKGSWLTQWLLHLGADVVGFSVDIPTQPSAFEVLKLSKSVKDLRGDIRDFDAVSKAFRESKPDVVFHMAAQPLVRASYDIPKETFDINVGGTVNVLECLRKETRCGAGVIVTSDKCYENREQSKGYQETDSLGGYDPYSASKAGAEIAFGAYARSFFKEKSCGIASVRAGNVIGGGDWAVDRIVPDCMRSWAQKNEVVLRRPHSVRPWQHVLEPLLGYLLVAQRLLENKENITGEAFNFGPEEKNNVEVITLVSELAKSWTGAGLVEKKSTDETKHEAGLLSLNCSKAKSILNWKPLFDLQTTCRLTTNWYKNYYESKNNMIDLTLNQIAQIER